MITTADTRQAIDLAIEAEDRGVSVERLALANDVHSERVIALARQLREILDEVHDELHRTGAVQGFTPLEIDRVLHELLAAMMPGGGRFIKHLDLRDHFAGLRIDAFALR